MIMRCLYYEADEAGGQGCLYFAMFYVLLLGEANAR